MAFIIGRQYYRHAFFCIVYFGHHFIGPSGYNCIGAVGFTSLLVGVITVDACKGKQFLIGDSDKILFLLLAFFIQPFPFIKSVGNNKAAVCYILFKYFNL